jgi:16S rRNA (uracil1498-N3)-methyltransferase
MDSATMRRDAPHDFLLYSDDLDRDSRRLGLDGDEHHHLSRVLRASAGDRVFLTNGRGVIAACTVDAVEQRRTRVRVDRVVEDRADEPPVTLALAVLKKDAFEDAVRQCTELGVTHFLPFVAAKSHFETYTPHYLERLRRIALSAMKQSFRSFLPAVVEAITFDALLNELSASPSVIVGEAGAPAVSLRPRPRPITIVVGPEGGLSPEERGRLESQGCELVSVSAYRLRSETAAATLAAIVGAGGGGETGSPGADGN